jgi:Predicted O-methyltransferase
MDVRAWLLDYAAAHKVPVMLEGGAKLLAETVRARKPRRILEIGTAIGLSGIYMLDNCSAHLYTIEIDETLADVAENAFNMAGYADRVTLWRGDVREIIRYAEGSYDFIMLDGPKGHYAELLPYLDNLLESGGVLFADNVLFKGYTYMEHPMHKHRTIINSLREYLAAVGDESRFNTKVYEVGDGVAVSVKR